MSQAKSVNSTTMPGGDPGHLLSLARQNANRVVALQALRRFRREAREEIGRLIAFLDDSDPYVMSELEDDDDLEEVGDSEPSLGSFDRVTDQEKSWRAMGAADLDAEMDTSDDEPSLGSLDHDHHPNQEQWAAGDWRDLEKDDTESGIADYEGLLEQVGSQDWQGRGMV
jgi:hypothetical protein